MMKMCRYALITALAIFLAGWCGVAGAARAGRRGQTAAAAACAAAAHGADRTGGALCPGAAWAD